MMPPSVQAAREVRRNTALRQARTCYDHLAGIAGVDLIEAMIERGWLERLEGHRSGYRLTSEGDRALTARGVDVAAARASRRPFARGCLDWTERRQHIAGAMGAAILQALADGGVVQREPASRTVTLLKPLSTWLGDAHLRG